MMISYNQVDHYDSFLVGQLIICLKRFHWKYRISHVLSFIGGALAKINLEMFAAILKLAILFYIIIDFTHFTHSLTLMASRDGFQTDMIENIVNAYKV